MSGASHCREVLTVRSCSPSGGLDVGSAQVHLLFKYRSGTVWHALPLSVLSESQACHSENLWIV